VLKKFFLIIKYITLINKWIENSYLTAKQWQTLKNISRKLSISCGKKCRLYRGLRDTSICKADIGDIIDMSRGFNAWTDNYDVAKEFTHPMEDSDEEYEELRCILVFEISEDINGIDIRDINTDQSEILLEPMKFIVVGRRRDRKLKSILLSVKPENDTTIFVMNYENPEFFREENIADERLMKKDRENSREETIIADEKVREKPRDKGKSNMKEYLETLTSRYKSKLNPKIRYLISQINEAIDFAYPIVDMDIHELSHPRDMGVASDNLESAISNLDKIEEDVGNISQMYIGNLSLEKIITLTRQEIEMKLEESRRKMDELEEL
jgi:hypothetical protein